MNVSIWNRYPLIPNEKYVPPNSIYNCSSSYAQLHVYPYRQSITCMDCIPKPHIHMYIQNLWRTAFLLSLSFSHISKKNVSPEILLLQPGLWNTIHRSSWWRGNCSKIQLEVYGDRWIWIPFSVIPLSCSLPYISTNMDSHGHTSSHSRSYMKSTQIYTAPCSQLQGNISAARVWSQWAALHCWVCSLSCLGGGRPPLSRYYPLPSNIHQLLGDLWWQVNLIG